MGRKFRAPPTFNAKLRADDKARLDALKTHPRETYGDVVHRLVGAELGREGAPSSSLGASSGEAHLSEAGA